MRRLVASGLIAAGVTLVLVHSTQAASVHLNDTYWGGTNTYYPSYGGDNGDVIGDTSVYDIASADVERIGNDLKVVINTAFAGKAGTETGTDIGYGALFFRSGGLTPIGTGPQYSTDTYQAGRFDYAFVIPQNPGSGNAAGAGGLFALASHESNVVRSNVNGNSVTYPNSSFPYFFRQDQAVQVNTQGLTAQLGGTWSVDSILQTITFTINGENGLLGSTFALAWAMTCANDVILGNVSLPDPGPGPVPLPGALLLFAGGAGMIGAFGGWRRRRQNGHAPA